MNSFAGLSDEDVLDLIREDSPVAFTELYDRYWKKLFAVAAGKLKDQMSAEELAQDILADIWIRRKQIKITTSVNAYLSVALKYKIIDHLARLNHRNKYRSYLADKGTEIDDYTQDWLSFEDLRQRLEKLISALPEKCEIVYRMSKEQGLSNKQIAREQSISEKTVEAHITRALKLLRNKLNSLILLKIF